MGHDFFIVALTLAMLGVIGFDVARYIIPNWLNLTFFEPAGVFKTNSLP